MVRGRAAIRIPRPTKAIAPRSAARQKVASEPRSGTSRTQTAKATSAAELEGEEDEPRQDLRRQQVPAAHRRGDEQLEELAGALLDEREAHRPHAGAHQVHAHQAGHQEVQVARAARLDQLLARRQRVAAPGGALQRRVDFQARLPALGAGGIEPVGRGVGGTHHEGQAAVGEGPLGLRGRQDLGHQPRRGGERGARLLGAGARFDPDRQRLGRLVAEGDAQGDGEEDREDEDPEDRLRLAQELDHARPGELIERRPEQARRAFAHPPSRARPACARKTSSSVA